MNKNGILGIAMIHSMKLERFKRYGYNGTPEYYPAKLVKCYKEDKFQKIVSSNGEEVVSKGRYYTLDKVSPLDRIDGHDLLNAEHFDFVTSYYVAYV